MPIPGQNKKMCRILFRHFDYSEIFSGLKELKPLKIRKHHFFISAYLPSDNKRSKLIDCKGDDPRRKKLKGGNAEHGFPASGFFFDCCKRCGAGNIQKAKQHHTKCVQRTEAQGTQLTLQNGNFARRGNTLHTEKHDEA